MFTGGKGEKLATAVENKYLQGIFSSVSRKTFQAYQVCIANINKSDIYYAHIHMYCWRGQCTTQILHYLTTVYFWPDFDNEGFKFSEKAQNAF